jgi:hypothetical protein
MSLWKQEPPEPPLLSEGEIQALARTTTNSNNQVRFLPFSEELVKLLFRLDV